MNLARYFSTSIEFAWRVRRRPCQMRFSPFSPDAASSCLLPPFLSLIEGPIGPVPGSSHSWIRPASCASFRQMLRPWINSSLVNWPFDSSPSPSFMLELRWFILLPFLELGIIHSFFWQYDIFYASVLDASSRTIPSLIPDVLKPLEQWQ